MELNTWPKHHPVTVQLHPIFERSGLLPTDHDLHPDPEGYLDHVGAYLPGYQTQTEIGMINEVFLGEGGGHGIGQRPFQAPVDKHCLVVNSSLHLRAHPAALLDGGALFLSNSTNPAAFLHGGRPVVMPSMTDVALHLGRPAVEHGDNDMIGDVLALEAAGIDLIAGGKILISTHGKYSLKAIAEQGWR